MYEKTNKFARGRCYYIFFASILGVAGGYFSDHLSRDILDRLLPLVFSVHTVLAGFFLTIIALVGAMDSVVGQLSADALRAYRKSFQNQLLRQTLGCITCLITVITAFMLEIWFCRAMVCILAFMVIISLAWALSVPYTLYCLFNERYEFLIENPICRQDCR
ncbi:MAG: hypothetical protein J1E80_07830 [Desulfovibrionaceae bacterium]|nr:hypothetical protein [Desulfovibrionaceae bacterium]